ncbi:L-aspartate oxidase [Balneolaceae bacterium ANBcel3]|nr:L-aspartate oxidase [Balneolaceae bacterium ANBcel3]
MHKTYDFLVLGSGGAGLSYALRVARYGTVAVITKKDSAESNTNYAQGGLASVVDKEDSFEAHIQDTLVAGAGLCHEEVVKMVVQSGPDVIRELLDWGARFTENKGNLDLGREGGHSRNRIVHAADRTGKEIELALLSAVGKHSNIEIFEHHFALELITEHHLGKKVTRHDSDTHCYGAYVFDTYSNKVEPVYAKATLLATGGVGEVYQYSTNPAIATGDGIAMAYRAKARVANMEFMQFHPTTLNLPDADSFLISEAVRGKGGILRTEKGDAFMRNYDERAELAPRDIVARAIDDHLKKSGDDTVYLDITHLKPDVIRTSFPHIHENCLLHGIDITKEWIPVVPAAHYLCGGVLTDMEGRTSIHGLYCAGEASCTGLHGANRLASNSLLEAIVFSKKAALNSVEYIRGLGALPNVPAWDDSGTTNIEEAILVSHNREELQKIMWNYVGIVRSDLRLARAFRRTHLLYEETESFYQRSRVSVALCELRNLIANAYMIIRSAMRRKESRGLHYTTDYPTSLESEKYDTII